MKFCPKCGSNLEKATKFCPKCGESLRQTSPPQQPKPIKKKKSWLKRVLMILIVLSLLSLLLLGAYFLYVEKNSQSTKSTTPSTSQKMETVVYESELANNERLLAASIAYYTDETLNWDLWKDLSKVTMTPIDEKAPNDSDGYRYCYQSNDYYYVIKKDGKINAIQLYQDNHLKEEIPFSNLVNQFTSKSILKDIQYKAEHIQLQEE